MESQESPTSQESLDRLWRVLVFGPLAGAIIGALQVTATFHVWLLFGRPDFWIGGRGGYDISPLLVIYGMGGMFVGVPFGLSVICFESVAKRRVPVVRFLPLLLFAAYVIGFVVALAEFSLGRLLFMVAEGAAILTGWALMFQISRRSSFST